MDVLLIKHEIHTNESKISSLHHKTTLTHTSRSISKKRLVRRLQVYDAQTQSWKNRKQLPITCTKHPSKLDPILAAAKEGDIGSIRKALDSRDIKIDECDPLGRTALHMAANAGNKETVKFLLQTGANPNCRDIQGTTPLSLAAVTARKDIIKLLCKGISSSDHHQQQQQQVTIAACQPDVFGHRPIDWAISRMKLTMETNTPVKISSLRKDLLKIIKMLENVAKTDEIESLSLRVQQMSTKEDLDAIVDLLDKLCI